MPTALHALITLAPGVHGDQFFSPMVRLGLGLLSLMAAVEFLREALNLLRGKEADFIEVSLRWAFAAMLLAGIPSLAAWTQSTLQKAGNDMFALTSAGQLEAAYRHAMSNFKCDDLSMIDFLAWYATPSPWLIGFVILGTMCSMVAKLVMIDVIWPIILNMTIIAGAVTIPIGFLRELGGIKHFFRNVAMIASWPLLFAILQVGMAMAFPQTLKAMGNGEIKPNCSSEAQIDDAGLMSNIDTSPAASTSPQKILHYIAICVGNIFFCVAIPFVSAFLFGGGGLVAPLVQAATGGMVGGSGISQKGK